LLALGLAATAAAGAAAGPSLPPVLILSHLLYIAALYGSARALPWLAGGGYAAFGLAALVVLVRTETLRNGLLTAIYTALVVVWPSASGLTARRHREGAYQIRRMVAALRTGDRGWEPVPASLDLARPLMERMENLGSPARLRTVGRPVPLTREIETVACRIIQESLTNVLKHGAHAVHESRRRLRRFTSLRSPQPNRNGGPSAMKAKACLA
jgi:hypothetical protein